MSVLVQDSAHLGYFVTENICVETCILLLASKYLCFSPTESVLFICITERVAIGTAGQTSGEEWASGDGQLTDFTFLVNLTDHEWEKRNARILNLKSPLCCFFPPQGLFFDDSYGFYPGQVLIGPSKVFSSVQWLSGVKPVLSTKSKFRVVVEEVRTDKLTHGHLLHRTVPGWHSGTESACHGNLPRANALWLCSSEVTNFSLWTDRTFDCRLALPPEGCCRHPVRWLHASTLRG